MSSLQSAIRVTIEFSLLFGETNFVEVPKIHEIHKICNPQKGALRYDYFVSKLKIAKLSLYVVTIYRLIPEESLEINNKQTAS